jgi:hypothetical protein
MLRSSWLLSAAILVSCAGCAEAPVEHTVRKVTAEDVRRDTEKAVDTAAQGPGNAPTSSATAELIARPASPGVWRA